MHLECNCIDWIFMIFLRRLFNTFAFSTSLRCFMKPTSMVIRLLNVMILSRLTILALIIIRCLFRINEKEFVLMMIRGVCRIRTKSGISSYMLSRNYSFTLSKLIWRGWDSFVRMRRLLTLMRKLLGLFVWLLRRLHSFLKLIKL